MNILLVLAVHNHCICDLILYVQLLISFYFLLFCSHLFLLSIPRYYNIIWFFPASCTDINSWKYHKLWERKVKTLTRNWRDHKRDIDWGWRLCQSKYLDSVSVCLCMPVPWPVPSSWKSSSHLVCGFPYFFSLQVCNLEFFW